MKLRRITEDFDEYEGLDDTDQFKDEGEGGPAVIDEHLRQFMHNGDITGGNLTPIGGESYLSEIKGIGKYQFPVYTEHLGLVHECLEELAEDNNSEWASEFQYVLRSAVIEALLKSVGITNTDEVEDDWRMPFNIHGSEWPDENVAVVTVSFD